MDFLFSQSQLLQILDHLPAFLFGQDITKGVPGITTARLTRVVHLSLLNGWKLFARG